MKHWLILILLLFAVEAEATTRWVSPGGGVGADCNSGGNTGTSDPGKYQTLLQGLACMAGGDTLILTNGTYTQVIDTNSDPIATGTNMTTGATVIRAQSSRQAIMLPTSSGNISALNLVWSAAAYIRIEGIVIDGSKCATCNALIDVGFGANHIRFDDIEVKNAYSQNIHLGPTNSGTPGEIAASNIEILNSSLHDSQLAYAVYNEGHDNTVSHNEMYNIDRYAIHSYSDFGGVNNNVYSFNNIYAFGRSKTVDYSAGIILASGTGNVAFGNIVHDATGTLGAGGIGSDPSASASKIYNNTIYNVSTPYWPIGVSDAKSEVRNNIIHVYTSQDGNAVDPSSPGIISNNFCTSAGFGCAYNGDPLFVDAAAGNFQLRVNSPALDRGLNLGATYNIDIAGINRDTQGGSAWDIGAYERQITEPPVGGNELVLALAFDEGKGTTTVDSSGKNNTVTLNNVTWDTGVYGASLRFNGINSSVVVTNSANFNLSNMTLEAWVAPIDLVNPNNFVSVIYKGVVDQPGWGLYAKSDTYLCPNLTAMGYFANTINNFACNTAQIFTGGTAWTHIAYTFDGTNSRFYHNGALVATQAASENMINVNGDLQIGASVYNEWFNGWIDEVRVYNYARSPTEIATDYNTPILQAPGAAMNVKVSAATEIKVAPTITMKYGQ